MRRNYIITLLVVIQACLNPQVNAYVEEDTWTQPTGEYCKYSYNSEEYDNYHQLSIGEAQTTEDVAALTYLKKFIAILFSRKHFKYDSTLQLYERSINFVLQSSQLDKLEQLQDPRDLDILLTEIFKNVQVSDSQYTQKYATYSIFSEICDIFRYMWQLTKSHEVQFLLVVVIIMLIGRILNARYNIGWLSLIFGGMFIYGYLHTYLECNRELQVNQVLEVINRNKGSQEISKESRFVRFLKNLFYADEPLLAEHQQLKELSKFSLPFCRPDHVLIMYFNDIFLKYLQSLLEQCTSILSTLNANFSFPYNILSSIILICLICYIITLIFKYVLSPSAWGQFVLGNRRVSKHSDLTNTPNSCIDDRISGDNLKLLLCALSTSASGVEDVKDAIEAPPKNLSPKKEKCVVTETQNNNNYDEKSLDVVTDCTLEDLSEQE